MIYNQWWSKIQNTPKPSQCTPSYWLPWGFLVAATFQQEIDICNISLPTLSRIMPAVVDAIISLRSVPIRTLPTNRNKTRILRHRRIPKHSRSQRLTYAQYGRRVRFYGKFHLSRLYHHPVLVDTSVRTCSVHTFDQNRILFLRTVHKWGPSSPKYLLKLSFADPTGHKWCATEKATRCRYTCSYANPFAFRSDLMQWTALEFPQKWD